jgi:ribose/xylose/arabinose/galactoside ABC-type transport system permease subunit
MIGTKDDRNYKNAVISVLLNYGILFLAIIIFFYFAFTESRIYQLDNLFTILRQASLIGLISLALMITIIIGDFDISVTFNANFSCVIIVLLVLHNVSLPIALLLGFVGSLLISIINCTMVVFVGLPSFVATIGMKFFLEGICRGMTENKQLFPIKPPAGYFFIGRSLLFGFIPIQVVLFILISIILTIYFRVSRQARYIHAIGENSETAYHVGIHVSKLRFFAYAISGILFGLCGVIGSSMYGIASSGMMEGYLIPSMISAFLGASFLRKGKKTLSNPPGTALAAMILALLTNGFTMLGLPFYYKQTIEGCILIGTMIMVTLLMRRRFQIDKQRLQK